MFEVTSEELSGCQIGTLNVGQGLNGGMSSRHPPVSHEKLFTSKY